MIQGVENTMPVREPSDLITLQKCKTELANITDLKTVLQIQDKARAVKHYLKAQGEARGSQNSAAMIAALAEARAGQLIEQGREAGTIAKQEEGRPKKKASHLVTHTEEPVQTLEDFGLNRMDSSRLKLAAEVLEESPDWFDEHAKECTDKNKDFTQNSVYRKAKELRCKKIGKTYVEPPKGQYDVIVIDPPWAIAKENPFEERSATDGYHMDYPTMTEDELSILEIPAADNCHVWVWATHKFLPMSLRLLSEWELKYVCTFVWVKPGGRQFKNMPAYNCEFAVYARKGTPEFVDTKKFPVANSWPRRGHSVKPEEFYDLVRRVTEGKRLDMFSRREIEGFENWGHEAPQETKPLD
jgi:N6-adenosine-specific RNA methylase IME4